MDWDETEIDVSALSGQLQLPVREKPAFLVCYPDMFHHYDPVLRQFRPEEVDLVLHACHGAEAELIAAARLRPYRWSLSTELLATLTSYRWLVSQNYVDEHKLVLRGPDGGRSEFRRMLLSLLGRRNIRFMYGLGVDSWHLSGWNVLYDAFLCQGEFQARQLGGFAGQKFLMGYPRFDAFFTQPFDKAAWLARFGCDPAKPVLVWFSTIQMSHGVIDRFAAAVSRLSADYNVLVKPHPLSWNVEPDYVAALDGLPFSAVIREDLDNLILYQLADHVLTDYGGTAFAALYTDRNLLLLDHPQHPGHSSEDVLSSDSDCWLRREIVHLGPDEAQRLPALLADAALWQRQKQVRATLRQLFFAPYYGNSAAVAAALIRQLPELLQGPEAGPLGL
ncbi:MAG TPA: hypothetical protein V6D23_24695 [Candidatus Obscuribacterales bacterium]